MTNSPWTRSAKAEAVLYTIVSALGPFMVFGCKTDAEAKTKFREGRQLVAGFDPVAGPKSAKLLSLRHATAAEANAWHQGFAQALGKHGPVIDQWKFACQLPTDWPGRIQPSDRAIEMAAEMLGKDLKA
jgi:hypothetical protein